MVGGALLAMGQWMDRLGRAYEQETKRSHKVMGCQRKGVWILLKCLESHRRAILAQWLKANATKPQVNIQGQHGGRRELYSTSCPLTSMGIPRHTHNKQIKCKAKGCKD